jgi:glycosyltransferase involved in cell wall biosynthesis
MKIVVDAITLLLPSAGVKTYLHYWLLSLQQESRERGDILATYPKGIAVPLLPNHEHSVESDQATSRRLSLVQFANLRLNPLINLLVAGGEVFHCSQHTANLPVRKTITATIFDFSCWTTPEHHTVANIEASRRYGAKTLRRSAGLIAISDHSRKDAVEILGIPETRIRVIYPGVAEAFFNVTVGYVERIRAQYKLDAPYILFIGCIEPRKNIPTLIRAYLHTKPALRREMQLVIAGPFGWEKEQVRTMLAHSGANVRYIGYVPEADLPGLVRGAAVLVYPSFYEGFGLPVAQAMAAGTPVITSNRSSLPEVVGDGGMLINPASVEELSAAIERVCTCPTFANQLSARGRIRAQRFNWSACAAESLDFFHDVHAGAV